MKNRKEKNTLFVMLHYFPYEIIKKKKNNHNIYILAQLQYYVYYI